jgi:hypothetical protein
MFDPLTLNAPDSTSPFSSSSSYPAHQPTTPPWPTTPHTPNSPIPNLRRAPSPLPSPISLPPPTPEKGPALPGAGTGLYGKEPQIYGRPDPGLISPRELSTPTSNGAKQEPYLRVRITGLDRNRRDVLIRLDAQVPPHIFCCL